MTAARWGEVGEHLPNQGRQQSLLYSAQAIGVSLVLFWVLCLQMTQQVSCPATISELLSTQLAGYSPNIFFPLRNDLRLFGKLPHVACSLSSHFHGSTRSSKFSQFLRCAKLLMNLEPIRQLLKADQDTTFRDEYPDN